MSSTLQAELKEKLAAPLDAVLAKHGGDIARMAGGSGSLTAAALQNDALVRKIAEFCHDALPWPLRMAVKKPVFVDYVLANRAPLIAKLSVPAAAPAAS